MSQNPSVPPPNIAWHHTARNKLAVYQITAFSKIASISLISAFVAAEAALHLTGLRPVVADALDQVSALGMVRLVLLTIVGFALTYLLKIPISKVFLAAEGIIVNNDIPPRWYGYAKLASAFIYVVSAMLSVLALSSYGTTLMTSIVEALHAGIYGGEVVSFLTETAVPAVVEWVIPAQNWAANARIMTYLPLLNALAVALAWAQYEVKLERAKYAAVWVEIVAEGEAQLASLECAVAIETSLCQYDSSYSAELAKQAQQQVLQAAYGGLGEVDRAIFVATQHPVSTTATMQTQVGPAPIFADLAEMKTARDACYAKLNAITI